MNFTKMSRTVFLLMVAIGFAVNGFAQSFLTNGLVAYYPFNGNANDASGNGNNGTLSGVTFVSNRYDEANKAASFASGNTYVECPTLRGLQYYPITYSVWFKLNSYPLRSEYGGGCTMTLLGRDNGGVNGGGALVLYNQDAPASTNELIYLTGNWMRSYRTPETNRWTHLVFTFDNSRVASFYLDGQFVRSEMFTDQQGADLPFRIGASANWSGDRLSWRGSIDDVRIYNRALSSAEVAQLFAIESGPRVDLIKAVKPSFSHLSLGTNYQMQVSGDMNTWTNYGSPFTATNTSMVYPQYFDVENWGNLFFQLKVLP